MFPTPRRNLVAAVAANLIAATGASVVLECRRDEENRARTLSFDSLPARFGVPLADGRTYGANLRLPFGDDPYFCREGTCLETSRRGLRRSPSDGADPSHEGLGGRPTDPQLPVPGERCRRPVRGGSGETFADGSGDGATVASAAPRLPIAVLVKRGRCTFEAKARAAMAFNDDWIDDDGSAAEVKFVIVYNNETHADETKLVPMSAECNETEITVALLFVNYTTGKLLTDMMTERANIMGIEPTLGNGDGDRADWHFPISLDSSHPKDTEKDKDDSGGVRQPGQTSEPGLQYLPWPSVLTVIFALYLTSNFLWIWYIFGGRIYVERTEGQIIPRLRVVRARGLLPRKRKRYTLTEEQVLDLPEVEFSASRRSGVPWFPYPDAMDGPSEAQPDVPAETSWNEEQVDSNSNEEREDSYSNEEQEDVTRELWASQLTCSICLEDFVSEERVRFLVPCAHIYHTDCILPWLTRQRGNCPVCKRYVWRKRHDAGGEDDDLSDEDPAAYYDSEEIPVAVSPDPAEEDAGDDEGTETRPPPPVHMITM